MNMSASTVPVGTTTMRIDPHVRYAVTSGSNHIELLRAITHASLDMVALTGIGNIKSYDAIQRDYDKLVLLEKAGILNTEDQQRLALHHDLRTRTTILPGFEVISADGVTVNAIFAADAAISNIETIIHHLDANATDGQTKTPANAICALIHAANGIAIAHADQTAGIEQIKQLIASNQLHALSQAIDGITEVCILGGSGATTLEEIGAGFSEVKLHTPTYEALRAVIMHRQTDATIFINTPVRRWAVHQLLQATNDNHIVQIADGKSADFSMHIGALANIGGGVLLIGSDNGTVIGIKQKDKLLATVLKAGEQINPVPHVQGEIVTIDGEHIARIEVRGDNPPYMLPDGRVMLRIEAQTVMATPDDLRRLCRPSQNNGADLDLPRSGVSIVSAQRRGGVWHYEVRDLRTTAGVTRDRAQGLWDYAIERHEDLRDGNANLEDIKWQGQLGLWRAYIQGGRPKYDLVHRDSHGVIDHIFYGVSDWGLGAQWQQLINTYAPQLAVDTVTFDDEQQAATTTQAPTASHVIASASAMSVPAQATFPNFQGERRPRWRGRGAITRIWRDEENKPRFDLLLKNKRDGAGEDAFEIQEYHGVTRDQLNQAWLDLVQVKKPRTGIEVVETVLDDQSDKRFIFRNLRNDEVSPHPWRMNDIEEGSIRQYAARMHLADQTINEDHIRWWGNIGYLRPMRRQVDLVYRDEEGVDHIYYAARRDELIGEWHDLLAEYDDLVD
jgi:hypothetical protein